MESGMKCLECNKEVKSINYRHLKYCCGLSPNQYKTKHNVNSLMDDEVKKSCAHYGTDNPSWNPNKHQRTWERICSCGRTIRHTSYGSYMVSLKKGTCVKCIDRQHWKGKSHTSATKKKISTANKGKDYNKSRLGVKESEETRKKKSLTLKNRIGGFTGKSHTLTARQKMSQRRAEMIIKRFGEGIQISPWYNKSACQLFEKINKHFRWNGQHAENGGEFYISGYWLDYYEPTQNIVIEFDEPRHNIPLIKRKDEIRQRYITHQLKCKFIRIKQEDQDNWFTIINEALNP